MDDWFGLQRGLVAVGLLAAVPGCADDKDKATESTGTDPGSTGASDGTGTGTGTTGTTGDPPTGTGSGSATDSGTGTTGEPTTGGTSTTTDATTTDATTSTSTTDTTTGGVDIPPVCQSYGAKVAECFNPKYEMDAAYECALDLMFAENFYGADCVQAYEAWRACLSALPCAEFDPPAKCLPESMAIDIACV